MAEDATVAQRRTVIGGIAVSAVIVVALWYGLYRFLPAPADADSLQTALACSAAAALFALVPGVEAVAHERLVTPAIDPLAGFETPRIRVNQRYLQNTLEQFAVFAAGLLALSAYALPRILIIVTIVWVLMRWAFWIGYHSGPLLRGWGAAGMLQSMLVLLFVSYRFASDLYGSAAGIAVIAVFVVFEAYLFWVMLRRPR